MNDIRIHWENTNETGNYSVQLVMIANNLTIGPKYTHFEVKEKSIISFDFILPLLRNIYIDFNKFIETKTSLEESIRKEIRDGKEIIDYKSWNVSLYTEKGSDNLMAILKTQNSELIVYETPLYKKYELHSSSGIMKIEIVRGITEYTVIGEEDKLYNQINENIRIYNEVLTKITTR